MTQVLQESKYPLDGKRVVWVMDDRVYRSGTEYRVIEKHPWEASPFANVHKYNHDVLPAHVALGTGGCTDCHRPDAPFFFAKTVKYLFDENAQPVTIPQYELLGLSRAHALVGAVRETYLKPTTYGLLVVYVLLVIAGIGQRTVGGIFAGQTAPGWLRAGIWLVVLAFGAVLALLLRRPPLLHYMLPSRFWLDGHHFLVSLVIIGIGLWALATKFRRRVTANRWSALGSLIVLFVLASLVLGLLAGALMLLKISALATLTGAAYTVFDVCIAVVLVGSIVAALRWTLVPADR